MNKPLACFLRLFGVGLVLTRQNFQVCCSAMHQKKVKTVKTVKTSAQAVPQVLENNGEICLHLLLVTKIRGFEK